jgi:hypothetical protein
MTDVLLLELSTLLIAVAAAGGIGATGWIWRASSPSAPLPEPPPPPPELPPAPKVTLDPEEVARQLALIRTGHADALYAELARNVRFTSRRELVGRQVTGERFLGVVESESPHPADTIDVRPIRDMAELPRMLPAELAGDEDLLTARLASGEALVQIDVETARISEPVYSPVYEDVIHHVYVLLDISPSMYPQQDVAGWTKAHGTPGDGTGWRLRVSRGVILELLFRARDAGAPFTLRPFDGGVRPARSARTEREALVLVVDLLSMPQGNATNIPAAIRAAVEDFAADGTEQVDVMIVTDGENTDDIDPAAIRGTLDARGMRLHAVMLGAKNEALRDCCDSYQLVEAGEGDKVVLGPLVTRPR